MNMPANITSGTPLTSLQVKSIPLAVTIGGDAADVRTRVEAPAASNTADRVGQGIDRLLNLYRRRNRLLTGAEFSDPRWHVLLAIARADIAGDALTTTDCAISAEVPLSTTIRVLRLLERDQLVTRTRDHADQRRVYVHLTGRAMSRLVAIFTEGHR